MKSTLPIKTIYTLFIALFFLLPTANAAPGDLDPTFSQDGKIFHEFGNGTPDSAYATALQADGKLVVLGTSMYGGRNSCGIVRYNPDGSLDTTFDGDGKKNVFIGTSFRCGALAIQADGKIIVAGWGNRTVFPNEVFTIVRLNTDGSFDNTFDSDGIATSDRGQGSSSIIIQPDGKIIAVALSSVLRFNSNGSLDTTFNGNGVFSINETYFHSAEIQADGKIVVVGRSYNGSDNDIGVFRLNQNGSLDTTFDGDGVIITSIFDLHDIATSLTIQPDGKIVVVGYSYGATTPQTVFVLLRYNPDGSLDTTFDDDGKVIMPADDFNYFAYDIAVRSDGKILTVGSGRVEGESSDFAAARFNADGSLDTTFGSSGKVLTDVSGDSDRANAMVVQLDGKIVAAGTANTNQFADFAVVRYNSEGVLDTTFDGDGKLHTDIGIPASRAMAVATQSDGKIVAVGRSYNGLYEDFTIVRYNTDGTPDSTFDGDGFAVEHFSGFHSTANSVAIQPDGKILIAGCGIGSLSGISQLGLMRFNPDGALDTTFDGDGKVLTSSVECAFSVKIQPDGKIVAAGNYNSNAAMARYNTDGSPDTTFDGDGIVITTIPNFPTIIAEIALQADGKIVAAGERGFNLASDTVVFRYNANGSLDTTFDNDGIAVTPVSDGYDGALTVRIQTDGKIIAAGASQNSGTFNALSFALVRYNPDGSLDATFDGDGKVTTTVLQTNYLSSIREIAIQPDGRILAAGHTTDTVFVNKSVLVRYNSDGSLDNFLTAQNGTNGMLIYDFMEFRSMTIDSLGRAVVAGDANGFFAVARILTASAASGAPFDFDGDRKTDISIYRPGAGEWWINRSSTSSTVAAQFGVSTDKIVPGDYTGDGKADIAVWRPANGEWFVLRSEDNSFYSVPFGSDGDVPVPADFDGDGKTDLAVYRPSNSMWYISRSTGGYQITAFGAAGDIPVTGNYDGDGKSDIAIFRPSDGSWWILKSTTISAITYRFGNSTDILVQGDYTGDGRTDSAVWRPSTGEWFIQRSEDNSYYSVSFGATGDIPIPGDYDGDGKFDTAVFRPTETNWYINRSNAGLLIMSFGLGSDRPVPSAFVP